jgi:hypothetical protein
VNLEQLRQLQLKQVQVVIKQAEADEELEEESELDEMVKLRRQ